MTFAICLIASLPMGAFAYWVLKVMAYLDSRITTLEKK